MRVHSASFFLFLCLTRRGILANDPTYDDRTRAFLNLFPKEILKNQDSVQELVEQFREDPSQFTEVFAEAGLDPAALLGIDEPGDDENAASPSTNILEGAIGGLFQLGSEILGLGGGEGGENNNQQLQQSNLPITSTEELEGLDLIKDILNFDAEDVFANISMGDGMEEVAAYFGVDHTDPAELDNFINSFGACEFCDTHDIDPTLQYLGMDCSDWLMFSLFSKVEECTILRAAAIEYCGCQTETLEITPTTPICDLCQDGSLEGVTLETPISAMSHVLSCGNITNVPAVEGSKTCEAVGGYAYICGCPRAEPKCNLCADGAVPSRPEAVLKRPDVKVNVARVSHVEDALTCIAFDTQLSMNTQSTCPHAIKELERDSGLAVQLYCGCPHSMGHFDGACEPCPPGYKVGQSSLVATDTVPVSGLPNAATCKEWVLDYAPYLLDTDKCNQAQQEIKEHCCEAMPSPLEEDQSHNDSVVIGRQTTSAAPSKRTSAVNVMSSLGAAPLPMAIILVVAFV